MKRRLWIAAAVMVLLAVLWCGCAMANEVQVSGTVNASSLPDSASVVLTGDTTLVVDVDKTLESIKGEDYTLTIQGSHDLTINPDNIGIIVGSFSSSLTGKLTVNRCETGIYSYGTVSIMNANVYLILNCEYSGTRAAITSEGNILVDGTIDISVENINEYNESGRGTRGINSLNGNISLSGNISIYCKAVCIFADKGKVSLNGDIRLRCGGTSIIADGDISFQGNLLNIVWCGITSRHGNITLNGPFQADDMAWPPAVYAKEGSVTLYGSNRIKMVTYRGNSMADPTGDYAIYAGEHVTVHNSGTIVIDANCGIYAGNNINLLGRADIECKSLKDASGIKFYAPGAGVRSENGNITLSGNSKVYGNNAIEAPNGSVALHGSLEAGTVDENGQYAIYTKNGIQSDCSDMTVNGPMYGSGGYYYLINFDQNGGSGQMAPIIRYQGATIILPECEYTAPEGMEFMQWVEGPVGTSLIINENRTIHALWGTHMCAVTFNMMGQGTAPAAQSIPEGYKASEPEMPTAEGYAFFGWYTDPNFTNAFDFTSPIVADTVLYARWRRLCTVTFEANGGSGTTEPVIRYENTTYELPECAFTPPEGYVFDRWLIGQASYNPGTFVTIRKDTTVKAQWKSNRATVVFDPNGGTGTMSPMIVDKGETLVFPACGFTPPVGKTFNYWDLSALGTFSAGGVVTIRQDIIARAVWRQARITFDSNGGTGSMASVFIQESDNGNYTLPDSTFTPPENMVFAGWDLGAPGTTITATGDRKVKAQWAPEMFTVSFVATSGSAGTMAPVPVAAGSVYTFPDCSFTPPSDKTFNGWLLGENRYLAGETIVITENTQLYAMWIMSPDAMFTATFDGNGLNGSMHSISAAYMEEITLPECTFETAENQRFRYWNVIKNGSSAGYYFAGEQILMTQNVTVKAMWETRPVRTVTFVANGPYNDEMPSAQTVYDGYAATEPEPPEMEGYMFLGWFKSRTASEESRWDFSSPVTYQDLTLYPGWQALPPVPHGIVVSTDGHGTAVLKDAEGNLIDEAIEGAFVNVEVTPDPGYEKYWISWVTADGNPSYSYITSGFTMPNKPVAVDVAFRPVRIGFILPAFLTTIEADAFFGINATAVVIPGSVTTITGDPFEGSSVSTIYGYPDSAAEAFTDNYPAYTFVPIDDVWMDGQ